MKYSDAELRNLAARATPLRKRWFGGVESAGDELEAATRLQRWQHTISIEGDPEIFGRRIALDRLASEDCMASLGSVRLADTEPLPVWVERLSGFLLQCDSADDDDWVLSIANSAEESLPFWEVWVPFVTQNTRELRRRAADNLGNLVEDALRTFQLQLLATLVHLAALPINLEFRRFQVKYDPLSIFSQTVSGTSSPSRDQYRGFVRHLHSSGLLVFFQEYTVLARLMAEVAEFWVEHVAEFCCRLEEDRAALAAVFNHGVDPGPVVQVRIGISDPHHRHRGVVIPTFATGLKIVYKPKDLGIDEAFWAFIHWLNTETQHGEALPLRTLTVLNRTTHGWVEFLEYEACQNPCEVQRYYRRIGMLLCVAYMLGGSDFHQENIIANGEQPVLLDLETMLQPLNRPWDGWRGASADQRALEIMHDSVLRTGLLPFWITGNPGKSYDVSGIGAEGRFDTGYLRVHWENVNTDGMQVAYRSLKTETQPNRPMLNENLVSAEGYEAEIKSGFTAVYRLLLARRNVLLADDGPLSRFRGVKLRYLLRMSKAYGQILNRRLHPEFLRNGADGSIEFERLTRDFLVLDPDPQYAPPWNIYCAEVDALERMDIPFFSFFSDSDELFADDRIVARAFFLQTGLERAFYRLRNLSEEDLRVQTDLIGASMYARYVKPPSTIAARPISDDTPSPPLTRGEFVAAAIALADEIRRAAIRGVDGGITWLSLTFDPTADRMNFLPMADSLYDGRTGVSFFLAALEHVTGGAGFRDVALAALVTLRKQLRQHVPSLAGWTSLGGASGMGGQLYALVTIARWLNDDELLHLAAAAATWFVPKRIALDKALDIFGGAAGGILGLLAVSAATGSNGDALGSAIECGHHLLETRVRAETGHLVWPARWASRPLTGFGHGAAGIAYALLRLYQATGKQQFLAAAEEAIAYETALYSDRVRNWPDFRDSSMNGDQFMVAWCNGAAGIGLGRLGGLPAFDTPSVRQDIVNALETTRAASLTDEDHICCGNLGRLDLLAEASRRLARPELLEESRRSASILVCRAERKGHYGLFAQLPGVTDSLSLFQGTAGIGYELLRLAEPDQMPCVLLWE